MAVAAHDGDPGHGQTELRTDNVNDSLFDVTERVKSNSEFLSVGAKRLNLDSRRLIRNLRGDVECRGVVVLGRDGEVGPANRSPGEPKAVKGLWARHFVHEVQVDVDEIRFPVVPNHNAVRVPHFLCESAGRSRSRGVGVHSAEFISVTLSVWRLPRAWLRLAFE